MTRKDYRLIASAIRITLESIRDNPKVLRPDIQETGIYRAATVLASRLGEDNPNFDRDKFMVACGLHEEETDYPLPQGNLY
jgi:hypothetical protein